MISITEQSNYLCKIVRVTNLCPHPGRDEASRELTEAWLTTYYKGDEEITLYMWGKGDNRKDCIVKSELFYKHVAPFYYVEAALDDRDQVVDLWRNQIGIKCLQVNYGNF